VLGEFKGGAGFVRGVLEQEGRQNKQVGLNAWGAVVGIQELEQCLQ